MASVANFIGYAAYWKGGLETNLVGLLPGFFNSAANGVNDQGQIVGWSTTYVESGNHTHAVIWTKGGAIRDLGTLSGGTESSAAKINFFGIVIGSSGNTVDFPPPIGDDIGSYGTWPGPLEVIGRPFIWSERSGMRDLNSMIRGNSGWVLNTATNINVWAK